MKLFKISEEDGTAVNNHHIDVLDGIRAMAILIVVWLHLWEQCWLMPIFQTPALSFLRINDINLDWLPRTGYMMVTMMIFLSGFCLYLPYARHDQLGEPLPNTKTFFRKRVARIIPSYMFCVLAIFIYNIVKGVYLASDFPLNGDTTFWAKDLFSHLTFTFNLIPQVASFSQLNGVLWTVALEVQFYLIFPLIVKAFRKKPVLTYIIMALVSFAATFYANSPGSNINFLMHQLPTYMGVYANGFLGAAIFVGMSSKIKRNKYIGIISTIISVFCIYVYYLMMINLRAAADQEGGVNSWQMHNRFYISVLFMIFCIATSYALGFYRKIFSNKVAVFISTISFNLYMWHQFLAVAFVKNHIPYYTGDTPPNQLGDRPWMWKHFLLSIAASLLMAILTTYLIEKPMAKLILGKKNNTKAASTQKQPLKKPDKHAIRNKKR